MKNLLLLALSLFVFASCKVSDTITADGRKTSPDKLEYDLISKPIDLSSMKTFKFITKSDATNDIVQLNKYFEKKLLENGLSEVEENPELLVQSVIASINYEKEELGYSGGVGLTGDTPYSPPYKVPGKYGKVIFLIQDAQSNEVLWMGTGTGILTANGVLNTKVLKSTLDELIAGLR
ncbi:DUF4136 domain-containing protein [Algoriphagus hitonicola]|uniref:DUF4136 domain-containing protein n=1 Tax=Algoriphagus hitonicola TaxID=435880 RepID=A0A1I2PE29_9BACT|nr:DUF4136 domain-containing protein [Algoriphagus hitonicola]SFG12197.1 protein of unknown function [Algoriphagus hitonicola]